MKLLLCSYPSCRDGMHSTFLLYWKGEATERMWESWSSQMRTFDAGICDMTKISVHAYITTKTGVSISPMRDGVDVVKTYGSCIFINGTRYMGNLVYNREASSVDDYHNSSSMMRWVVGGRNDFHFSDAYISKLPRLRCYSMRFAAEDGEIISNFFQS